MKIRLLFLAAFMVLPGPLLADETSDETLDNIVVTATRTPVSAERLISTVTVIDRETIVTSNAIDLAELLAYQTGIDVARNGGPGQSTSVFIRGTESNHALVLINGIEMNPATLGGAAFQNLSTELIERVEIVRGPRSTLYGSEAVGGVINVITRDGSGSPLEGSVSAGRYGTQRLGFSGQVGTGDRGLTISAEQISSDGFPTHTTSSDDRGFENLAINVDARQRIGEAELGLRFWQAKGNTEYSAPVFDLATGLSTLVPADQDFSNRVTALTLRASPGKRWNTNLKISQSTDEIDQNQENDFSPPGRLDFAHTKRSVFDFQSDTLLGSNNTLSAGVYYEQEDARSLSFGSSFDERSSTRAIYLANQIDARRHSALVGARFSDRDEFGNITTWNVDYGFEIATRTRLTASIGRAFRAPDATDRYGFGGNPDLDPEDSRTAEIGIRHAITPAQQIQLALFDNQIDDLIEFAFDPVTFTGMNINIGKAEIRGIEAQYRLDRGPWHLTSGATLMDAEDAATGEQLPRRARRRLTAEIDRHFSRARVGVTMLAVDERKDSGFSELVNAGYLLIGLRGTFDLGHGWQLTGRLDNAFDTDYETAAGFNSPGRSLSVSLRYTQ